MGLLHSCTSLLLSDQGIRFLMTCHSEVFIRAVQAGRMDVLDLIQKWIMVVPPGQEIIAWEGRFSLVFPWVKWSELFEAACIFEILVACGEHFQNRRKAELCTCTILCDFCRSQIALGLYFFVCYQTAKRSWCVISIPLCHPCYLKNVFLWSALTPEEVKLRFTVMTNELVYFHIPSISFKEH